MIVQVAPVHQVQDEAELVRGVEGVGHAYNEWTVVSCHNTNHLSTEHDPDVIVFKTDFVVTKYEGMIALLTIKKSSVCAFNYTYELLF